MSWYPESDAKPLLGKVLDRVGVSADRERFTLHFADGTSKALGVEGECCSSSWIEHLEAPEDLRGAILVGVENSGRAPWDDHDCRKVRCEHDSLAVYHTVFHTTRGDIILEYRNDSNGYYGGYLVSLD